MEDRRTDRAGTAACRKRRDTGLKHAQKARIIFIACIILVGVFSGYSMYRSFRPSGDLPYEQISMEKALEYMEYETGYILLDVSSGEDYSKHHIPGAVNIPYSDLADAASKSLPDPQQMIYICAARSKDSRKAAKKLCNLGYTNITEIGSTADWKEENKEEETE